MVGFFLTIVAISLSGVMAPGPITAATLAAGARSRHAGALIALGHAVVEMPLLLLLAAGVGTLLTSAAVKAGLGLAGGAVMLLMAMQLLFSLRQTECPQTRAAVQQRPIITGIVLTGANPYFLVWWATIGLGLAVQAAGYGVAVLAAFGVVHWLCDLVWLEVLSLAGFQSSKAFGPRSQRVISLFCGVVLLGFGLDFLCEAGVGLWMQACGNG